MRNRLTAAAILLALVLAPIMAAAETPTLIWEAYAFVASPNNAAFPAPKPGFQPVVLVWVKAASDDTGIVKINLTFSSPPGASQDYYFALSTSALAAQQWSCPDGSMGGVGWWCSGQQRLYRIILPVGYKVDAVKVARTTLTNEIPAVLAGKDTQ